MAEEDGKLDLVRIDATGTAHPVGKTASQRLRGRQGAFRLMPSPPHLVVMRFVGEDGRRDEGDGPVFRLAGELTVAGSLCDIVALVGQAGWRGELVVLGGGPPQAQGNPPTRSVFFDHAHVIAAASNVEGERLGEVLYRYGALNDEQLRAVVTAVQTEGIRFGEACVRLGFLTREKLFQLMGKQTEEIVYALLRVGDGMFFFLETFDEARIFARFSFSVNGLLMEGVRRMDETKYFRERIPSPEHVPARAPGKETAPEDEVRAVWEAVDGTRSVADICRVVGQGEFDVTQSLFQLVQSGHVHIHAPRPTGPTAVVALFNQALKLVFSTVDAAGKGSEVRDQLASYATGAGVYDALFMRAGPDPDGTFQTERVVENVERMFGDGDLTIVRQWLYDYVSFAVFVAEPQGGALAKRVADIVAPLSPQ